MCKVTRSKENFFDDDVSNNQNHSFFFEEGRFSSLSFFLFFLRNFLFFFETIFEISFWAKNQKEIRFLAFFRRRRLSSSRLLLRTLEREEDARRPLHHPKRAGATTRRRIDASHRFVAPGTERRASFGVLPNRERKTTTTIIKRRLRWGKKDSFIPLLNIKPDQKPPLKRREKREKERTYRCEQRGGGGRGDGRLGELLRQVGRLDRLVDRTVSKGEERAIGERAAKRFIRGESHSSPHHHHGPKNKRTKY